MITIESAFYVFMKADTYKRLSIEANKRKWYGRVIISSDSDPYYFVDQTERYSWSRGPVLDLTGPLAHK